MAGGTPDYWAQFQPDQTTDPSRTASGDPYGTMPGSQNTGISGGLDTVAPDLGTLGTTPMMNPTLPGNAQLPGYGDWNTSNPWRDSLTYEQIRDFGRANPQAASGTTPTPTQGGSGQQWDQNYFTQNFGTPSTPQELEALSAKIEAAGGKVIRNAAGVAGKIQTPDGRVIDVINSAGAGGKGFQWLEGGGGSGGQSGNPYGFGGFGSFVTPMSEFSQPTEQDALNSPGLQFALSEANRMGLNAGAARGVLGNGRFQQALAASNIQNALQGYGDVYNRAANTFGINYGVKTGNQDRPFDKYYKLGSLGQQAVSQS